MTTSTPATPSPTEVQETLTRLASTLGEGGSIQQARLGEVLVRVADFLQLNPGSARSDGLPLEFLLDVVVPVTAELGRTTMPIGDLLKLEPGTVVELDREVSQPVDLMMCGVLFARGEVVVVQDRFAVRIKELVHPGNKKRSP